MHFSARVVKGRNAKEHVVAGLIVVLLLHAAGVQERAVRVQDRLREARGAGGEVDSGVVVLGQQGAAINAGALRGHFRVILGKGGAARARVNQKSSAADLRLDLLNAADKFGAKHKCVCLGKVQAICNFVRCVTEVQRHGKRAGL